MRPQARPTLVTVAILFLLLLALAACGEDTGLIGPEPIPGGSVTGGGNPGDGGGGGGGGSSGGGSSSNADLVYVVSGEIGVAGWKLHTTGQLTTVPGLPAAFDALRIGPALGGNIVFVATSSDFGAPANHRLFSYRVETASGTLTRVAEYDLSAVGSQINWLVAEPSGRMLYVSVPAMQQMHGFSVDANGVFTPLPGSPWIWTGGAYGQRLSPDGTLICGITVIGRGFGMVRCMERDPATGALGELIDGLADLPYTRVEFSSDSRFLLASAGNQVDVFTVNRITNVVARVPGSPFPTTHQAVGISVRNPWVAVAGGDRISVFTVDSRGILTEIAGSPFNAPGMQELEYSASGRFLVATGNGNMMVLRVDPTGILTQIGSTVQVGASISEPTTMPATAP